MQPKFMAMMKNMGERPPSTQFNLEMIFLPNPWRPQTEIEYLKLPVEVLENFYILGYETTINKRNNRVAFFISSYSFFKYSSLLDYSNSHSNYSNIW